MVKWNREKSLRVPESFCKSLRTSASPWELAQVSGITVASYDEPWNEFNWALWLSVDLHSLHRLGNSGYKWLEPAEEPKGHVTTFHCSNFKSFFFYSLKRCTNQNYCSGAKEESYISKDWGDMDKIVEKVDQFLLSSAKTLGHQKKTFLCYVLRRSWMCQKMCNWTHFYVSKSWAAGGSSWAVTAQNVTQSGSLFTKSAKYFWALLSIVHNCAYRCPKCVLLTHSRTTGPSLVSCPLIKAQRCPKFKFEIQERVDRFLLKVLKLLGTTHPWPQSKSWWITWWITFYLGQSILWWLTFC